MTATATAPRAREASTGRKTVPLGAVPRVSLMPPELGERNRQLGIQRSLRLLMFAVVVLIIAGVGGAWYLAFSANLALQAEQSRTADLLLEQQQYAEVQAAIRNVELGESALRVGGSTEIDWQDYLGRVQASLPAGVVLDSFTVDAATVTAQYPQSSIPLQGARIATLRFSAVSATLPEIPAWLNQLRDLPGFVDAMPGSVTRAAEGAYTASIEMHIDAAAYSNRLTAEEAAADESDGQADEETEQ